MIETNSRLSEVQDLLRQLPVTKRGILLKSVTELFVEGANRF